MIDDGPIRIEPVPRLEKVSGRVLSGDLPSIGRKSQSQPSRGSLRGAVGISPALRVQGPSELPGAREPAGGSADLSSVSGMLAGFVDLAGLGLPKPGPFAPFVGAGIGVAHTRIGKTTMTFPETTTTVPGGSRTELAWMATAGLAVVLV